ncbi:MAG: hypothetical protein C5B48_03480 [Candidatus Rokuibacteriota bacterium]|nr:MAG: hypothetical protein C5B48_03480 [Candidatus Rokubacteria bacterium]
MLQLAFERRGPRTVLTERRFTLPLQALECMDLDDSGVAALLLLNPTGGLVGGDVLETSVTLGRGSRVCLSTPSATRVYRSAGPPAVQRFRATVGQDAQLEWVPGHLIPSPGARLRQTTDVTLGAGASLLFVDSWAVGRVARGERWRFDQLDLSVEVRDARGLLVKDRCVLDAGQRDWLGAAEGFSYLGTFIAAGRVASSWDDVAHRLRSSVESLSNGARVGVSTLGRGGVLARLLCPSAPALAATVQALWSCCRRHLYGLAPLALRKL